MLHPNDNDIFIQRVLIDLRSSVFGTSKYKYKL